MRRLLLFPLLLATAACGDRSGTTDAAEREAVPVVYVVNYPLRYFAERIGADRVAVHFPAPPDVDPAFWEPDDETIAAYQGADLILLNGATYAKWTRRAALPPSRCVDTSAAFADELIEIEGATSHSHGPGGEHTHAGTAFTTWLDLEQARQQATAVRDALIALVPRERAAFERAHAALDADLRALDAALAAAAPREPVIASHPVYQYWARRYGVDLRSVMFEPDELPDEEGWAQLEALLSERPARIMLWEGEPLPATRARLEQLGLEIRVLPPCGNVPEHGDLLSNLR